MKSGYPPACNIHSCWTINCESNLPGLRNEATVLSRNVPQAVELDTCVTDRLCINRPFTAKCKFWVRLEISAMSAHDRYLVIATGVIYGALATLCRSALLRLCIVSLGVLSLVPFVDKECGDINEPRKRSQCIARNT